MSHRRLNTISIPPEQIKEYSAVFLGPIPPVFPNFEEYKHVLGFSTQSLDGLGKDVDLSGKDCMAVYVSRQQLGQIKDEIANYLDKSNPNFACMPTPYISINPVFNVTKDLQTFKAEIIEMAEKLKREAARQLKQQTDEMSDRQNKAQALIRAITEFIAIEQTQQINDRENNLLTLNPARVVITQRNPTNENNYRWEAGIVFNGRSLKGYGHSEKEARLELDKQYQKIVYESWR
jgi:hypothetical protein